MEDGRDRVGTNDSSQPRRPGAPVDPARVIKLLVRRRWVLLALFVAAAAVSIAVAKLVIRNSYTAQAMLRFEGVPEIEGAPPAPEATQQLGAMVQALFTDDPLREIANRMGMTEVPVSLFRNLFEITYDNDRVTRVTASAESAVEAARFVNTAVDVFLETQLERERARLGEAAAALDARIQDVERSLAEARRVYDGFRTEHGITDLTVEQEAAIEEAAQLRADRDTAASDVSSLEARIEQLQASLRSTPRTTGTVVSTSSREQLQLAELQAQLASERGNLAPDHPRVRALEEQVARLQAHVASAGRQQTATSQTSALYQTLEASLRTAQAELSATRQQLANLDRLAQAAQERLTQFNALEGRASTLLSEVRRHQASLEELQAQHGRLTEAARNPAHGLTVIARATPPELPDPSKKKKVVAVGVPIGVLFVCLLGLIGWELRGLKVLTAREAAWWGGAPVIAASTWPRSEAALDDLVADLDDMVLKADGSMLVVPLRQDLTHLTHAFTRRLGRDWFDTTVIGGSPFDPDASPHLSLPPEISNEAYPLATTAASRAHHDVQVSGEPSPLQVEAWEGADFGPGLRRAARLADRVCVLIPAGASSGIELRQLVTKLGRQDGVGFIVVGLSDDYANLPDRVGPVEAFWAAHA